MSNGRFSDTVMDHFMNPRNIGSFEIPDAIGTGGDPHCGDFLVISIKVHNDVIEDIRFLVFGCTAAVASSSMTTVLAKGKTLSEAEKITDKDIVDALGGLPEEKIHCSVLGETALKNVIKDYRNDKIGDNQK